MLITELGSYDMIIGRNFFDYFHILIDIYNRRLQWPQEFLPAKTYSRTIATYSRDDIRPKQIQKQYQLDLLRRDRAIALNEKRRKDGIQIRVLIAGLTKALPKDQSTDQLFDQLTDRMPHTSGNTWT